jgi:hypothetical protein
MDISIERHPAHGTLVTHRKKQKVLDNSEQALPVSESNPDSGQGSAHTLHVRPRSASDGPLTPIPGSDVANTSNSR